MKLHTVFFWLYDNFLEGNTDEIKQDFFGVYFSYVKPSVFIFFIDKISDRW